MNTQAMASKRMLLMSTLAWPRKVNEYLPCAQFINLQLLIQKQKMRAIGYRTSKTNWRSKELLRQRFLAPAPVASKLSTTGRRMSNSGPKSSTWERKLTGKKKSSTASSSAHILVWEVWEPAPSCSWPRSRRMRSWLRMSYQKLTTSSSKSRPNSRIKRRSSKITEGSTSSAWTRRQIKNQWKVKMSTTNHNLLSHKKTKTPSPTNPWARWASSPREANQLRRRNRKSVWTATKHSGIHLPWEDTVALMMTFAPKIEKFKKSRRIIEERSNLNCLRVCNSGLNWW